MDFGPHQDNQGGKQSHFLESYFNRRNARMDPNADFNNIDRDWRTRWKSIQTLSENDGKLDLYRNPDFRKAKYNIFRRITRAPMDWVEFNLLSKWYPDWRMARGARGACQILFGVTAVVYYISYYSRYCANDWQTFYGWKSFTERPPVYPGSTEWPNCQSYERTEKHEYAAYNFDIEKDTKILTSTPLRYS